MATTISPTATRLIMAVLAECERMLADDPSMTERDAILIAHRWIRWPRGAIAQRIHAKRATTFGEFRNAVNLMVARDDDD